MNSILDPHFVYRKAVETDLRKTFARERKRIKQEQERARQIELAKVRRIG